MNCLQYCQGGTYIIEMFLDGKREGKSKKLGRVTESAVVFDESHWMSTETFLLHDLVVQVRDKALTPLGGQHGQDASIVFKARIPPQGPASAVPGLAKMLRQPPPGSLTTRYRPTEPMRLRLDPTGAATRGCEAELLLRFWPAWDPESVPSYQRYFDQVTSDHASLEMARAASTHHRPARRVSGWLEKKAKGIINHWAPKWVVIEENEFKYWDDKKYFERGHGPKVRIKLTSKEAFRFAAGEEKDCFVQVVSHERRNDGEIEAKWRPQHPGAGNESRNSPQSAKDWLKVIFESYITEEGGSQQRRPTLKLAS